jgi:hypothetical protein
MCISEPLQLLTRYIEAHNAGVRTGDFTAVVSLFHTDGKLRFQGASLGPFSGRAMIAKAFRDSPPVDQLTIQSATSLSIDTAEAIFGWKQSDARGRIVLRATEHGIDELVVFL